MLFATVFIDGKEQKGYAGEGWSFSEAINDIAYRAQGMAHTIHDLVDQYPNNKILAKVRLSDTPHFETFSSEDIKRFCAK